MTQLRCQALPAKPVGAWWMRRSSAVNRSELRSARLRSAPALAQAEQEGLLEVRRLELDTVEALLHALQGCTALVIATGARPSINLAGPLQVDAWGVQAQCLPLPVCGVWCWSVLCAGRWLHPLNLFGLILVWKRVASALERSGLDWTVIRPGGLSEDDSRSTTEGVLLTDADQQQSNSIPRRLVAQVCGCSGAVGCFGRILEITSSQSSPSNRWPLVGSVVLTQRLIRFWACCDQL